MDLRPISLCLLAVLFLTGPGARAEEVVGPSGDWRLLPGRAEAPSEWRSPGFDDSTWSAGPAPFFYGLPLAGTELKDMRGVYPGVYLRRTFVAGSVADIGKLTLRALADDGFVAWINGHEIARHNMPDGEPGHATLASSPLDEPPTAEDFPVAHPWTVLVEGTNVLAVLASNASLAGSDDFAFAATLIAERDLDPPVVVARLPVARATVDAIDTAEVVFSEAVAGMEAEDLLVNGIPATAMETVAPDHFVFRFTQPAPGLVTFTWRDGHGITDDTGRANAFAGDAWRITLDPKTSRAVVTLSEFMADDDRTLVDEDNDSSDWIEVHNGGGSTVKLLGWSLTDDAAAPGKWRFPDIALAPAARLVVFASQKDKTNITGRLHTNFKLSAKGGYLALVAPDGQVVSDFGPSYPPQTRDVSYGRVPGAADRTGFFTTPTPGAPNSVSGQGFASAVVFSRASGPYTTSATVRLSAEGAGASVRYTLDGTLPDASSPLYDGPLHLETTVQLRARAFAPGLLPGPPRSETYLRLSESPFQTPTFTSALPVLVISTFGKQISQSVNTPVTFELFEPVDGLTSLARAPTFATRGGAKVRGSSTAGITKSSWAIEWWDEFNQDVEKSVLGMPAESEWVLYAPNNFDLVQIHNPFMYELSRQIGRYAPRTRFVEVYLNRGGTLTAAQWFGTYVLEEKIGIGKHRVDIDRLQPEDRAAPEVTGGYLLKVDRLDPGDSGFNTGGDALGYVDPKEPVIETAQRDPQEQYIRNYFLAFNRALTGVNWRSPQTGYAAYIDTGSWIDHHLLNVLSANPDCLRLSTYLHKPRSGKITFGPIWDFDRTLGSTDGRDANPRAWGGGGSDFFFTYTWWGRLFQDPDFYQLYLDRYQELRDGGPFSTAALLALVDRFADEVRPAEIREGKRWPANRPRGGTYQAEVVRMKSWLSNRVDFIDRQLAQPPGIMPAGGVVVAGSSVTLTGPAGAPLYYTLDGSDPRRAGSTNVPSASAKLYSGPVAIGADTRLTVRSFDATKRQVASGGPRMSSPWSRAVTASFTLRPSPIVVSELMYHPAPPPAGSPYPSGSFEFIELENISDRVVDLVGSRFVRGVQFVFAAGGAITQVAPGGHVLLVRDPAAFASRYPGVTGVAGTYDGDLAGDGERLTMLGPVGETWADFTYHPSRDPLADGAGFSLVASSRTPGATWRLSAAPGGSPGRADPVPTVVPAVRIGEVLANPRAGDSDFIELSDPSATPADIGGWWLSDDLRLPKRWRVPSGTKIPAGGAIVLRKDQLGASFALPRTGGAIWIFSASAEGDLTGWHHGTEFGASDNGVSFGREVLGTEDERFLARVSATPGRPDSAPLVGPLVFDEIHFRPPPTVAGADDTTGEFIDLRNIGSAPLSLGDPARPRDTWHVRGGIELDLPAKIVVPIGGHVVLVAFDPRDDIAALGRFRARYGLPADAVVAGPWHGVLKDAGESIRLLKPGVPDLGTTPYVLVEEVGYSASAPWPADTSGTGRSLVRSARDRLGALPGAWTSAWPTPGSDDSDFDGLPDAWESANGLDPLRATGADGGDADADGDGLSNRQEFLNRTDPRDPGEALRIGVQLGDLDGPRTRFAAPAGSTFVLQSSTTLADGWQTVQTITVGAEGFVDVALPVVDEGYYRVVPAP